MLTKLWNEIKDYPKWVIAHPDHFFTFLIGVILGIVILVSLISNIWGGLFTILFAILVTIHTLNFWKIP